MALHNSTGFGVAHQPLSFPKIERCQEREDQNPNQDCYVCRLLGRIEVLVYAGQIYIYQKLNLPYELISSTHAPTPYSSDLTAHLERWLISSHSATLLLTQVKNSRRSSIPIPCSLRQPITLPLQRTPAQRPVTRHDHCKKKGVPSPSSCTNKAKFSSI